MTFRPLRGPIVIDTNVFGADLLVRSRLAPLYEPIVVGRPMFISFQTVAELRFGALRANWGQARVRKLEARIRQTVTIHTGPELVLILDANILYSAPLRDLLVRLARASRAFRRGDERFLAPSHSGRFRGGIRALPRTGSAC